MQLYETVNGEVKVRLLRDHQPNQAMLNEFQTAQFDCKMTKMELCGSRLLFPEGLSVTAQCDIR